MPKFDVSVYAIVFVRVQGVEAESPREAVETARESTNWNAMFSHGENQGFSDAFDGYIVDQIDPATGKPDGVNWVDFIDEANFLTVKHQHEQGVELI